MDAHSLQTPEQIKQNPFKSRTSESPLSSDQTKAALVATLFQRACTISTS